MDMPLPLQQKPCSRNRRYVQALVRSAQMASTPMPTPFASWQIFGDRRSAQGCPVTHLLPKSAIQIGILASASRGPIARCLNIGSASLQRMGHGLRTEFNPPSEINPRLHRVVVQNTPVHVEQTYNKATCDEEARSSVFHSQPSYNTLRYDVLHYHELCGAQVQTVKILYLQMSRW